MSALATTVLTILMHLLVLVSIFGATVFVIHLITSAKSSLDKLMRSLACVTGILSWYVANALGIPISAVILQVSPVVQVLTAMIFGTLLASFIFTTAGRGINLRIRLVITLLSMIAAMYTDLFFRDYAASLLPCVSFVLGMMMYVVFAFTPVPKSPSKE